MSATSTRAANAAPSSQRNARCNSVWRASNTSPPGWAKATRTPFPRKVTISPGRGESSASSRRSEPPSTRPASCQSRSLQSATGAAPRLASKAKRSDHRASSARASERLSWWMRNCQKAAMPPRMSRARASKRGRSALLMGWSPKPAVPPGACKTFRHFRPARVFCTATSMQTFYITTAIDYVNGSPHLGHAYEKVLTDVIARFRRLMGDKVRFLTGVDEHGQKVQQTARARGIDPQQFCDEISQEFRALCAKLDISNDDFIRTTEPRHKKVVAQILQQLFDQGLIYKAEYQGFYSTRQEQFLQEKDRNPDGTWPELFGEVTEITESNYFFKLRQYQDWLIDFLKTNENFVFPRYRQKQVLEFLSEPLNDLCISRPKERLEWGIELPFDTGYVTYVWFDALLNYFSAVADQPDCWPADFHVIGKDILVPPHAVYWPIMLKAAGIEPPKSLLAHGWWSINGSKMSKSTGNFVDPIAFADQYGVDALRFFMIREMSVGQDSDFSIEQFFSRYNS